MVERSHAIPRDARRRVYEYLIYIWKDGCEAPTNSPDGLPDGLDGVAWQQCVNIVYFFFFSSDHF